FDGTSSVTDCLQYLCDIGRAVIVNRGNVIGVVVDRSAVNMDELNNPLPLFNFDDSNIVADTYSENYSDRSNFPTEVQVTYYDKDREYSRKSVIVRNDDSIVNHNTKDVTLYACDDRDVALRHAEYILNMNLIKKGYAWTGDLDSMPLDMGDLVSIYGNLATITGVTFDDEMRRQFTAVNYSHERFGWRKWDAVVGDEGVGLVTFPFTMAGVAFNDLFTGISYVGKIKAWYPNVQADSISPTETWEANKGYLIIASAPIEKKLYKKSADYTSSIHLTQGDNFISLSYDILDYESTYAYINGVNMAYDVVFQKRIYRYMGAPLVEDVEPDPVTGKINLYAGEIYVVNVSDPIEGVDFPMFPPK
ncbi:MAG TPA: phage tail protein, partial [Smithella sp.]|nr:phage tail protein [Smithella sp.]